MDSPTHCDTCTWLYDSFVTLGKKCQDLLNLLQEIFDRLCDFDEKGMSYIFEAARNPTRLYDQMAKLLAHPLQRPLQSEIAYRLHNIADLTDTWY